MKTFHFLMLIGIIHATTIASKAQELVPEDAESMDGYVLANPVDEIDPEDDFADATSLLSDLLLKAIRQKRSPRYKVLESEGLRSHFRKKLDLDPFISDAAFITRTRRSVDVDEKEQDKLEAMSSTETLPSPQKLLSNSGYYQEQWARAPYESSGFAKKEDTDSQAEPSAANEGIKARAPRVNFITQNQNGKNLEAAESRDARSSTLPETTTPDYYRRNLARIYLDVPHPFELFKKPFEKPFERYDVYEPRNNLVEPPRTYPPPYPEYFDHRRPNYDYDSYMPRTLNFPNYYYYPDKRFDVPEMRDNSYYPPPSSYAREYPPSSYAREYPPVDSNNLPPLAPQNRNRRIIYYTTLPEVVRTPPNVDMRYRNSYPPPSGGYESRHNPYGHNYYAQEAYRANRSPRDYPKPIGSITQLADERKSNVPATSAPMKSSGSRGDQSLRAGDHRMFTEVKDSRTYQDDDYYRHR